jgi:hypothetical protein
MITENLILKEIASFQIAKQDTKTLTDTTKSVPITNENKAIRSIRLYSPTTNNGTIYVGVEGLTQDNHTIELKKGLGVEIQINNLKNIYVLPTNAGDKINYLYVI